MQRGNKRTNRCSSLVTVGVRVRVRCENGLDPEYIFSGNISYIDDLLWMSLMLLSSAVDLSPASKASDDEHCDVIRGCLSRGSTARGLHGCIGYMIGYMIGFIVRLRSGN